jgi:hypothetical protein
MINPNTNQSFLSAIISHIRRILEVFSTQVINHPIFIAVNSQQLVVKKYLLRDQG